MATSQATTTNTSQLLFGNDNLQSHTQKSPTTTPLTDNNVIEPRTEDATHLANTNNSKGVHNQDETMVIITNNCHKPHNQEQIKTMARPDPQERQIGQEIVEKQPWTSNYEEFERDIDSTLDTLLSSVEAECSATKTTTTSQSTIFCPTDEPTTKVALVTPVVVEEEAGVTKDIVTLRNLEITPPPQPVKELIDEETPTTTATTTPDVQCATETKSGKKRRVERLHSETTEQSDESTGGRSKRQRKQTELFQVESNSITKPKKPKDVNEKSSSSQKQPAGPARKVQSKIPRYRPHQEQKCPERVNLPATPAKKNPEGQSIERPHDFQDVICYEKNDYLAIRNEENTFYLCQLTENVRVQRPFVKIRWLDTMDNGKTYFITSHYDKIPQKSIIMPVMLNKMETGGGKGKPIFTIDEQIKDTVMERLKRSLNVPTEDID